MIRMANEKDKVLVLENKEVAQEAYETCQVKIKEHDLEMNLVDVEYTFDRNKVIFFTLLQMVG